jgi:hypothetical protein
MKLGISHITLSLQQTAHLLRAVVVFYYCVVAGAQLHTRL